MNREEFIQFMNNPQLLDKHSVDEIRELVQEFPYFQSGHLLFLKNLHLLDNIRFPGQLRISAAHITDREVLYHLLRKPSAYQTEDHNNLETTIDPVTEEILVEDQPVTEVEDTLQMDEEVDTQDEIILIDENEEISDHDMAREDPVVEEEKESRFSMMNDLLEFEYTHDVIDQDYSPEHKDSATDKNSGPDPSSFKDVSDRTQTRETERYSFAAWLDLMQDEEMPEASEEKTPSEEQSSRWSGIQKNNTQKTRSDFFSP